MKMSDTIRVPFTLSSHIDHLLPWQKEVLARFIKASEILNIIFLKQAGQSATSEKDFDDKKPFAFYPEGFTKENLEGALGTLSFSEREKIESPFSIVSRKEENLVAEPYKDIYAAEIKEIVKHLTEALSFIPENDKSDLRQYITETINAFLTDGYLSRERFWIHAELSPFSFVFGPYEEYDDELLGKKKSFESLIGIRNDDWQKRANLLKEYQGAFDVETGKIFGYTPRQDKDYYDVVDVVWVGGSARFAFVPMACNLPNERDIVAEEGCRKTFFINIIRAKYESFTGKCAEAILGEPLAPVDKGVEIYFNQTVGHEISHGIGVNFGGGAFGHTGSMMEESKADVFGLLFQKYLVDKGVLTNEDFVLATKLHIARVCNLIRKDTSQAHAGGALVHWNWFTHHGAIRITEGRIIFNNEKFISALEALAFRFRELSDTDEETIKAFLLEWGKHAPELEILKKVLEGIPEDLALSPSKEVEKLLQ